MRNEIPIREILAASIVDFKDAAPQATSEALQALRAQLAAEGGNLLTSAGIRIIDRELARRG